jgi:hypothetical protein
MGSGASSPQKKSDASAGAAEKADDSPAAITPAEGGDAGAAAGGGLAEVAAILQAYNITSPEDMMRMDDKYNQLKAEGAHGFGLLQGLHAELRKLHAEKERRMSMADVVAQARERVNFLMRQVSDEAFSNFVVGVDGSKESNVAYEVNPFLAA